MKIDIPLARLITRVMLENEPKLLAADTDTSVRCAHALAVNMGCVMSFMLEKEGEANFEAALQFIMGVVRKNAHGTVAKANVYALDPKTWTKQ